MTFQQVDPATQAAYRADGAVCLRQAFDPDWLEKLGRGIARNLAAPGKFFRRLSPEEGRGGFFTDMWSWFEIEEFRDFAFHSPAAALAAQLMGSREVRLLQDTWFVKLPGTAERTPWHHDHVVQGPFCSIWLPLDPHPRGTSLELVRGSHLWGRLFMPPAYFEEHPEALAPAQRYYREFHGSAQERGDLYALTPDIEADRDAYEILSWDLEPGDCIVFNALTLHGAPGNAGTGSSARRFVTRWTGEEAVVAPHGDSTLATLEQHGFHHGLRAGDRLCSELFPVVQPGV